LTPGEVAEIFRVDPKTVTRWAQSDRLPSIMTPGGHRRFWETDVVRALSGGALGKPNGPVREVVREAAVEAS
jgi:excisionase family DNA binding protein